MPPCYNTLLCHILKVGKLVGSSVIPTLFRFFLTLRPIRTDSSHHQTRPGLVNSLCLGIPRPTLTGYRDFQSSSRSIPCSVPTECHPRVKYLTSRESASQVKSSMSWCLTRTRLEQYFVKLNSYSTSISQVPCRPNKCVTTHWAKHIL